jgi:hypothetical protein
MDFILDGNNISDDEVVKLLGELKWRKIYL